MQRLARSSPPAQRSVSLRWGQGWFATVLCGQRNY